ncbi:HD domain-containing protein [Candidatus Kuenenbacteria bacterium]|nr:HD domain-containing protein [Candidatus Kuenenbacteria bacterium]
MANLEEVQPIAQENIPETAEKKSPPETKKAEQPNSLEKINENYGAVLDHREAQYDKDIEAKPEMGAMRSNLEMHNKIVLGYAGELVEAMNLPDEQRVAAIIATIEHDSGKLASGLLDHHEQGTEYAGQMLDGLEGQEFEGVTITPEIKQKVMEAIERHMNHPFLVMLNKGERFPEPKDDVDRVVFDADMMANAGF